MNPLTKNELQRYGRHLTLPEVGVAGQATLKAARVLCVGLGGLGSPVATYLAAAGIGTLGLVDDDVVSESNLQRQVLFGQNDLGDRKVDAAARRLLALNPAIELDLHGVRLGVENALELVSAYDLVVDGSDNFPTRYLVNDAAAMSDKPLVYGSVLRFAGQLGVFHAGHGPCYRCLFPEPPAPGTVPSCAEAGVLGALPGLVGSLQALEAMKLILGAGDSMLGRLLLIDGLGTQFQELSIPRNPSCDLCGDKPTITNLQPLEVTSGLASGKKGSEVKISPVDLARELASALPPTVLDVRSPLELDIVRFPGALEIPLAELEQALDSLSAEVRYVVTCHKGARAEQACVSLQKRGFGNVAVLIGGIDEWAAQLAPDLPRY